MKENTYWGYHLIINAAKCNKKAITSPDIIEKFVKDLVMQIDMVAYGEPQIIHFGEGNKAGYTLVQLIETSNICAHFCDDTGDAYIDVFSCKPYNKNIVLSLVDDYFLPANVNHQYLERQA
jgi:S-adenosylmethionine/arginine decarboxylase-like enzyme